MKFGKLLRARRLEKKMSIRQVALHAECSDSYLSLLERGVAGRKGPTPNFLRKLEKPLGVPYEILLSWAGYTLQTKDEWVYSGAIVLLLRSTLGDDVEAFATRVDLSPSEVEAMERSGVRYETFEAILQKLFCWERVLSPGQTALILRMKSTLPRLPAQYSLTVELLFHALLEMLEVNF